MIRYEYKTSACGVNHAGWADRIRVCYTPEAIVVKVLNGTNESEFRLSPEWNDDCICAFNCDAFNLEC